jgi:hypothetical protein
MKEKKFIFFFSFRHHAHSKHAIAAADRTNGNFLPTPVDRSFKTTPTPDTHSQTDTYKLDDYHFDDFTSHH